MGPLLAGSRLGVGSGAGDVLVTALRRRRNSSSRLPSTARSPSRPTATLTAPGKRRPTPGPKQWPASSLNGPLSESSAGVVSAALGESGPDDDGVKAESDANDVLRRGVEPSDLPLPSRPMLPNQARPLDTRFRPCWASPPCSTRTSTVPSGPKSSTTDAVPAARPRPRRSSVAADERSRLAVRCAPGAHGLRSSRAGWLDASPRADDGGVDSWMLAWRRRLPAIVVSRPIEGVVPYSSSAPDWTKRQTVGPTTWMSTTRTRLGRQLSALRSQRSASRRAWYLYCDQRRARIDGVRSGEKYEPPKLVSVAGKSGDSSADRDMGEEPLGSGDAGGVSNDASSGVGEPCGQPGLVGEVGSDGETGLEGCDGGSGDSVAAVAESRTTTRTSSTISVSHDVMPRALSAL